MGYPVQSGSQCCHATEVIISQVVYELVDCSPVQITQIYIVNVIPLHAFRRNEFVPDGLTHEQRLFVGHHSDVCPEDFLPGDPPAVLVAVKYHLEGCTCRAGSVFSGDLGVIFRNSYSVPVLLHSFLVDYRKILKSREPSVLPVKLR